MSTPARALRGGALVLAVLLLVSVPGLAVAKFVDGRAAPLAVSTATMVAPEKIKGTYDCFSTLLREGVTITVSEFDDKGPAGAAYLFTLSVDGDVVTTTTSREQSATITGTQLVDLSKNSWTIQVQATIGGWTSPADSKTVSCKVGSQKGGKL